MVAKLRIYFRNLPLSRKIFWILMIVLVPVVLLSLGGAAWIARAYSEQLYRTTASQLAYSAQEISGRLQDLESLSYMIYSHDQIQKGLEVICYSDSFMDRGDATSSMRRLLTELGQSYRGSQVSYINVYSGGFSVSSNSYAVRDTPTAVLEAVRQEARQADGSVVWYSSPQCPDRLFLGRAVREIRDLSHPSLGEEIICVDIAAMVKDATWFNNQYESAEYLILRDDEILYTTQDLNRLDNLKSLQDQDKKYQSLRIGAHNYFAVRGSLPQYGWEYLCLVPFDKVKMAMNGALGLFVAALLLCLGAVLMLASALISSLNRHFQVLLEKMKVMGEDAAGTPLPVGYDYSERTDEIGMLHQQFDQMAAKIQNLIRINYVNELLKKEAQLKALENQINPHFLYNTLESVNWRAKALGAQDISTMVQSLAALLRVTLSSGNTEFTLGRELELVQSYMAIQRYRFEDRLVFQITAPQELYPVPIVKLTIQPLVENAIHYGLEENTETCEISITVRKVENTLQIAVANTGSIFEEDLLEKLDRAEIVPRGHGIGLLNINKRLKLTYGEQYGLELHNETDCAVATVTIPIQRGTEPC